MTTDPRPKRDPEEAAQGQDSFRAPGDEQQLEEAREQAIASGWLPPDVSYQWPSQSTHQAIVTRRQDLYEAMRGLEASVAWASGQNDWAERLHESLENLDEALARHVTETEAPDGLFNDVVEWAPHLTAVVRVLRAEHEDLIASCRAALELLEDGNDVPRLRRKIVSLLGRLTIHRQTGVELLFDAYNVDLGSGD